MIDGKQRVESAVAWFTDDLAVPASWFPADRIESTVSTDDGKYVTYFGLTLTGRRLFAQRAVLPVIEVHVDSIADEAALYGVVNIAGTEQTPEDIETARRVADTHI